MPGALVVISSSSGREVRSAIAGLVGVSNVILVGDGAHAIVDDAQLRIPELRETLQRSNIPFADIAVGEPSIEDVFVALLENNGGAQ